MKALTLTPPWGTLIACGEKAIETRSWPTSYRGMLAIHQAKSLTPIGGQAGLHLLLEREPFASVLPKHLSGYTTEERMRDLPRGVIVALAQLTDVIPTRGTLAATLESAGHYTEGWTLVHPHEEAFGDYSPGRYAWVFGERLLNLYDGYECSGGRGLWDVPDDVLEQLRDIDDIE